MINFLNPEYESNNLLFSKSDDWIVIQHFKKYTEILKNIDDYINNKINDFEYLNTDDCEYDETFWNLIVNDFKEPLNNLVLDYTEEILRCDACLNGSENPRGTYDPTIGKVDGIFAKLVSVLDKGAENFIQNYTMAKQVSKFVCDYMDIFKKVRDIQDYIKYGKILYYFDNLINDLQKSFENYKIYITYNNYEDDEDLDCNSKKNMAFAYYNNFTVPDIGQNPYIEEEEAFAISLQTYKEKLKQGLTDLNTLLDAMDGFMDELYIAVKVLGALNIVFYMDEDDIPMFEKESQSTFDSMVQPNNPEDSEAAKASLKTRTIWAMGVTIPIGITAQKYLDDTRSNQSVVFGSAVNSVFYSIGFTEDLNTLRTILNTQYI